MGLYCGIDWATPHHDVAVTNDDGKVVARGGVGDDAAGLTALLILLAKPATPPKSDPDRDRN